jgi:hypothetical protein
MNPIKSAYGILGGSIPVCSRAKIPPAAHDRLLVFLVLPLLLLAGAISPWVLWFINLQLIQTLSHGMV